MKPPDLVCVVPDKNIESAIRTLLDVRRPALGLSAFVFDVLVHPRRDPGCYHEGPAFLRGLLGDGTTKCLLVLDHAWEGNPHASAVDAEHAIRARIEACGIGGRADVVVIEPEVEAWVFSGSPHVDTVLGWAGAKPDLRTWLSDRGLWPSSEVKPPDPKAAMEAALREKRIPRSSSLYRDLAMKVSLDGCRDGAFARFRAVLARWFSADPAR